MVEQVDALELKEFEADRSAAKDHVRNYGAGAGTEEDNGLKRDFTKVEAWEVECW